MRLSVIIPAWNEERYVGTAVDNALRGQPWEVLVVDGESGDRTVEIADAHGAVVLTSPAGRGVQLHRGATSATGDTLLFLHADCQLPADYPRHVEMVMRMPDVVGGAFRLRIDGPQRSLRFVERMVGLRCRLLQMPYGDQAIFVGADAYRRLGGFAPLPAMEDFEFIRRLRKLGHIQIAGATVLTSSRGWTTRGVWRTTLLNRVCITAYRLGVPAERIAAWRRRQHGCGPDPHGTNHADTLERLTEKRKGA